MRRLVLLVLLAGCSAPPAAAPLPASSAPDPAVVAAQVRALDAQADLARAKTAQLQADATKRAVNEEKAAAAVQVEEERAATALAERCAKERADIATWEAKQAKKAAKRPARQTVPDGVDVTAAANDAPEQVAISGGLMAPRLSVPCGGESQREPKSRTFDATRH